MDRNKLIKEIQKAKILFPGTSDQVDIGKDFGQGGNGVVFSVKYGAASYALKVYTPPESRELNTTAYDRFKSEIELAQRFDHPFVIKSIGTGHLDITTFRLPYYIMPRAVGTLRSVMESKSNKNVEQNLRIYLRACLGLSYIHNHGIIHRDLKPENILLFDRDSPAIADLGIAHINPLFMKVDSTTGPEEKLYNKDYYAPEQRYGDATKVTQLADLYAMGCILYEMLSGIPATRPNLPKLVEVNPSLASFDPIVTQMLDHNPEKRQKHIDFVIEELVWAIKSVDLKARAYFSEDEDKLLLSKTIRSKNLATQEHALDVARRLGSSSVPVLIEQLGNNRIDVARAAYRILGELQHPEALKYLVAGLYARRSAKKLSFPTGEAAANALRNYPTATRLQIIDELADTVDADHIEILIRGIEKDVVFEKIKRLHDKKIFYVEWSGQPGIGLLLKIDQELAWPSVEALFAEKKDLYTFVVFRDIYPFVNDERKKYILDFYLNLATNLSAWELPRILDQLQFFSGDVTFVLEAVERLKKLAVIHIKRYEERDEFLSKLEKLKGQFQEAKAN